MQTTFEQVVEAVHRLSAEEIHKLGVLVREKERQNEEKSEKRARIEEEIRKFNLAMKWIDEHRDKYLGKWVCLDGDRLISFGEDGVEVYNEAVAKGIEIPFVNQVREEEKAYLGGWEACR